MDELLDDKDFWLSAGVDQARRRWGNYQQVSPSELLELGQAMVQTGPGAADRIAASIERAHPELTGR